MATTSSVSNSKRHKVSANVSEVDRISTLPDSIISRILSLLPTKYAVATSVLSTKWRFRWTSIYNLDFDYSLPLLYPEKSSADKHRKQRITSNDEMKKLSFVHFVNRVILLLNPQCICKFRFTCSNELVCDRFQVAKWISVQVAKWISAALSLALASDFVAPVFHNLTRLELNFSSSDWHLIPALLESSYNLECLACNEVSSRGFGESTWTQPSHVPKCLLSCFKSVQINLRGYPSTDELSLLSYILKNAKVMEKMTIHTSWNSTERFKLIQKIAMFPRGSQTCQVDFA